MVTSARAAAANSNGARSASVELQEAFREIVFVAPLSLLGSESIVGMSPRLAVLGRSGSGKLALCEWELDTGMCLNTVVLSDLDGIRDGTFSPTDFSFTSFTPFPGRVNHVLR
eukprot:tig00000430_g614.t1